MILQISHLQKSFEEKKVLTDASFSFEKGKIYEIGLGIPAEPLFRSFSKEKDASVKTFFSSKLFCK